MGFQFIYDLKNYYGSYNYYLWSSAVFSAKIEIISCDGVILNSNLK